MSERIVMPEEMVRRALQVAISLLTGGRVNDTINTVTAVDDKGNELTFSGISINYGSTIQDAECVEVPLLPAPSIERPKFQLIQGGRG